MAQSRFTWIPSCCLPGVLGNPFRSHYQCHCLIVLVLSFSIWNWKGFVLWKMTWGLLLRWVSPDRICFITGLVNVENNDSVFLCWVLLKNLHSILLTDRDLVSFLSVLAIKSLKCFYGFLSIKQNFADFLYERKVSYVKVMKENCKFFFHSSVLMLMSPS